MSRIRRVLAIGLVLIVAGLGAHLAHAAARPYVAAAAIQSIHVYQRTLAPWLSTLGWRCRFVPTCSRYAEASIRALGVTKGSWQALKRVARCGPWTPPETSDPPPRP